MPDRPNVLWLMCDQMRGSAMSCAGEVNVQTPNLDRLAAEGTLCTQAFTTYPVCVPARAALVTGQFSHTNRVTRHGDLLPTDSRTVAHAFREAGYRTAWVGKWHLASVQSAETISSGKDYWVHPLLRGGFQDWYGFDYSNQYYNTYYSTGEQIWPPRKVEGYQTDGLTDLTLRWLDEVGSRIDQPWFHVWSVEAPHGGGGDGVNPHWGNRPAPPGYNARFHPSRIQLKDNVPEDWQDRARELLAGYYAMIANLDDNVGRILARLDELGLAENTIVVFFADHGEMGGSHGFQEKYHIYDESIGIPLVVRYPAGLAGGRVTDELAGIVDLFPTTAALAGVPVPAAVQGLDLSAMLRDEPGPRRDCLLLQWVAENRYSYRETFPLYRGLRTRTHTYQINDAGHECLFDNEADPLQLRNLAEGPEAEPHLVPFRRRLRAEMLRLGDAPPPWVK